MIGNSLHRIGRNYAHIQGIMHQYDARHWVVFPPTGRAIKAKSKREHWRKVMKKSVTGRLFTMGILALGCSVLSAQTVVNETSTGDLMVIDYSGKPPFKRKLVRSQDRAEFARFESIQNTVLVSTSASRRSGPPGKNLPAQQARFERVPEADISQFARFEETDKAGSSRMWRGAPGKGRPRVGQ